MSNKKIYLAASMLVAMFLTGCSTLRQDSGPFDTAQGGVEPGAVASTTAPSGGPQDGSTLRESSGQAGSPQEGIKVHGHWTIEVRNPDGTLVSRREFENALDAGGRFLAAWLARRNSVGRWWVVIISLGGCPGSAFCAIAEPTDPSAASFVFKNLTVSVGADGTTLVLKGTVMAGGNGRVDSVATQVDLCPNNPAPVTPCGGADNTFSSNFFTRTILPTTTSPVQPAVNVLEGQQIQVTVVISFS